MDIPLLKFPRDKIIEIVPAAYQNEARRIHIPGLDLRLIPGSPDDIRILGSSAYPSETTSGQMSPIPGGGLGMPAQALSEVVERPPEVINNTSKNLVADKVDDED